MKNSKKKMYIFQTENRDYCYFYTRTYQFRYGDDPGIIPFEAAFCFLFMRKFCKYQI